MEGNEMKKYLLTALFIGLLFTLAACGEDDGNASTEAENTGNEAVEQTEDTAASEDAVNEINLVSTNFSLGDEDVYTVKAGEEVTITHTNEEGHHGIAIDEFDVDIEGDGEATFIPDEPGEYEIYCNIFCGEGHEDMVVTLVVV